MAAVNQTMLTSEYACNFCKRRKVKCDRILPCCSICQKARQECNYPLEAMKPGPKIGSLRRTRKRTRSHTPERRAIRGSRQESTDPINPVNAHQASNETSWQEEGASNQCVTVDPDSYPLSPATTPLDIRTLAYLVHPSHEVATLSPAGSSLDIDSNGNGQSTTVTHPQNIMHACSVLEITVQELSQYIDLYFDNVTAFSLFHQPSFRLKIESISSSPTLIFLLASICSLSARFRLDTEKDNSFVEGQFANTINSSLTPTHFETLAKRYADEALNEYSDNPPSLCLLQALVLHTFQQLIKGVRGAAWRRLGVCIRAAYELYLHRVDCDNIPETEEIAAWCDIEERRRTWWAIWEMDVFASTIKRCPTGIDWTDNETRLPVADEYWFKREFQSSCFLERKSNHRLAALQKCGNEGGKAWFLLLNSFMRDGHVISHFRSPRPGDGRYGSSSVSRKYVAKETAESLAILANALTCFGMALPKPLQYQDEFLNFTNSEDPSAAIATRQLHCAKYSIHVMTQLARLQINHHDAYQGALQDLDLPGSFKEKRSESDAPSLKGGPKRKGFQECMAASDELLLIVRRCSHDHIRYVNPFLASTIWYGAAVHLTWKVLAPATENLDLIFSKFEVMRMSFDESTAFWDLPKTLSQNLRTMEEKLRVFKSPRRFSTRYYRTGQPNPNSHDRSHDVEKRNTSKAQLPATTSERNINMGGISQDQNHSSSANWEGIADNMPNVGTNYGGMEEGGSSYSKSVDEFDFDLFIPANLSGQSNDNFIAPRGLWDDFGLDMDFAANSDEVFRGLLQ